MMNKKILELLQINVINYINIFKLDFASLPEQTYEVTETYEIIILKFKNNIKSEIEVRYIDYASDSLISLSFSRFNEDGYINSWLRFVDYFDKYKNIPDSKGKFFLSNNSETIEAELKQFFDWLISATDPQLIDILQGKDWVDIPFDWGEYR
ncbi:MAG: hypothetical protein PSX81_12375 [bacterium]|nr:hypothetical protein [bacterium]